MISEVFFGVASRWTGKPLSKIQTLHIIVRWFCLCSVWVSWFRGKSCVRQETRQHQRNHLFNHFANIPQNGFVELQHTNIVDCEDHILFQVEWKVTSPTPMVSEKAADLSLLWARCQCWNIVSHHMDHGTLPSPTMKRREASPFVKQAP